MYTRRLNLLMQGSIMYSVIEVVTHHYQRFSCSQYLYNQFNVQESEKTLTITKMNTMHAYTHRFAYNKGLNKARNGLSAN
ncbi:hypothetical protein H5410_061600, partial [Solanum commersonii]